MPFPKMLVEMKTETNSEFDLGSLIPLSALIFVTLPTHPETTLHTRYVSNLIEIEADEKQESTSSSRTSLYNKAMIVIPLFDVGKHLIKHIVSFYETRKQELKKYCSCMSE